MAATIDLLWADAALLVLHKPAGLLSVPGRGADKQDCLSTRVQQQFADALVVHRLDMATSGLLLMARGLAAQQRLSAAFAERRVGKRYSAIVAGDCRGNGLPHRAAFSTDARASATATASVTDAGAEDWKLIDLPILVDWPRRPLRKIDYHQGKPSQTRWRCSGYDPQQQVSRLELEPLTGRSHQLRLHLAAIGHPILGDSWYAPEAVAAASPRLLLHACRLTLEHPFSGVPLAFECPDYFGATWPPASAAPRIPA